MTQALPRRKDRCSRAVAPGPGEVDRVWLRWFSSQCLSPELSRGHPQRGAASSSGERCREPGRGYPGRQEPCGLLGALRSRWQVTHTSTHSLMHPPPHQPPRILIQPREHVCISLTHTHLPPQPTCTPGTWTPHRPAVFSQVHRSCPKPWHGNHAHRSPIQVGQPAGGQIYLHIICMC